MKQKRQKTYRAPGVIAAGFAAAIAVGSILLMLPAASADGSVTSWSDALFTSASSLCAAGLVTLPAGHWSGFGNFIILLLMQLGGFGVITVSLALFVLFRRHIPLRERILILNCCSLDSPQGMIRLLTRSVKGALAVEGIGTYLLSFRFIPEFGLFRGIWYAVFHAVSAFCNAGMVAWSDASFMRFADDWYVSLTVIGLILAGGIGFPVWWDLLHAFRERRRRPDRNFFGLLTLHAKLALSVSIVLLLGGMVLIYGTERTNPLTLGGCSEGGKWLRALFYSASLRTAGLYTVDPAALGPAAVFLSGFWMLIGGSPAGTAGGMKTTTVGMLVLTVRAQLQGKRQAEGFGRRIAAEHLHAGMAVFALFSGLFFAASLVLLVTDGLALEDAMYEAASAIGTVGLTRGVTPLLSAWGKGMLVGCMAIGRTMPVMLAIVFALRRKDPENQRELPEQKIIIG